MMKVRTSLTLLIPLFLSIGGGVALAQPITSKISSLPADPAKIKGTGVLYSKSYFQERYMQLGRTIAYALFIGGAYQQAVWQATGKYEGKVERRQDFNAFETLLGDYDVNAKVNERLRAHIGEASRFDIQLTSDVPVATSLISFASVADQGAKAGAQQTQLPEGSDVAAVFKVSYGFGARAGREQLGFKKTYRPFVRLLGVVRRGNGEVLWHGAVIAWGSNGYKGKPDAKAIPRDELTAAFDTVSDDAVKLLIRSLNGEKLDPMGELVDETKEDARF